MVSSPIDHLTTAEDTAVLLMYDTRNLFLFRFLQDDQPIYRSFDLSQTNKYALDIPNDIVLVANDL